MKYNSTWCLMIDLMGEKDKKWKHKWTTSAVMHNLIYPLHLHQIDQSKTIVWLVTKFPFSSAFHNNKKRKTSIHDKMFFISLPSNSCLKVSRLLDGDLWFCCSIELHNVQYIKDVTFIFIYPAWALSDCLHIVQSVACNPCQSEKAVMFCPYY